MTPEMLKKLKTAVARKPRRLSELCRDVRESGSQWSDAQVRLALRVYTGIDLTEEADPLVSAGRASAAEQLRQAVYDAVQSQGGRPVPIARVLELLPSDMTTSVAQVKSVAKKDERLVVKGQAVGMK